MKDDRSKRDRMPIEEATASDIWKIVAITETPKRKGLCTEQTLYDINTEFCCKSPYASISEMVLPDRYFFTRTKNMIIDAIPDIPNMNGLASWAGVLR